MQRLERYPTAVGTASPRHRGSVPYNRALFLSRFSLLSRVSRSKRPLLPSPAFRFVSAFFDLSSFIFHLSHATP